MSQTSPTFLSQSPTLDPACLLEAGSRGRQLNNLNQEPFGLDQRIELLETRYETISKLPARSISKRLQLSEELRLELIDEINSLREVGLLFSKAARAGGEDKFPENLARTVNILGMCFLRLATLMRAQADLTGKKRDKTLDALMDALQSFEKEVMEDYGIKPD